MCRGLKDDDGKTLIDLEEEPWKFLKISTVKPSAGDYKEEIERRNALAAASQGSSWVQYRPKAWILGKVLQWLDEHPISAADDVAFLKKKVEEQKQQSKEAADAKKMEKESLEKSWTGSLPYLRLIHCLIEHYFPIRSYGDPPAKYRMAHANRTVVAIGPFGTGGVLKWRSRRYVPR